MDIHFGKRRPSSTESAQPITPVKGPRPVAYKIRKQSEDYTFYECSNCKTVTAFNDLKCPNCKTSLETEPIDEATWMKMNQDVADRQAEDVDSATEGSDLL